MTIQGSARSLADRIPRPERPTKEAAARTRTVIGMSVGAWHKYTATPPRLHPHSSNFFAAMRIAEHVQCAIDHMEAGKFDPALLHACIAIDATAKRRSPQQKVRSRYVQCIRDYYWLVEPMLGAGIKKVYALGTYFLSLGEVHYLIDAWWGREKEFRPIADAQNQVRVKFEGLTTHGWSADGPIGTLRVVQPGYGPRAT